MSDLLINLGDCPSLTELARVSEQARREREVYEARFGRQSEGYVISAPEIICESPESYRMYLEFEKASSSAK